MRTLLTNPRSAAIASLLLALPFTTLFLAFVLGMEPSREPLDRLLAVQESHLGSIITLGAFLLLLAAFAVSLVPLVRNARAGTSLTAAPFNLLLAGAILLLILIVAGGIVVDQYPCWVGVPNCD